MKKWILRLLYTALVLLPVGAIADYTATTGAGSTVFAFVCSTTKICPATVLIDSSNVEKATSGNPLRTDPTGTTAQPVSAAANAYAAGSLAIGAGVDGWSITDGVTTDPASTAGGTGTHSAKLRLMTTQLNTINTTLNAPMQNSGGSVTANIGTAGTLSTAANQTSELTKLDTIITNTGAAIPAGEAHVGEIGSNQIKVQVAQTVTASSAYASGNAIGGLQTIAGAARVSGSLGASGTGGILTGLTMNSKSLQTTQVDVFLFDANPSGSTCTDKTAFSLATADFDKVIGVVTIPGTAANGAGWYAGTVGSAGIATYYPVTYDLSSATSIFACAVTRGTPTYTATTDVSFKYNILRN